MSTVADGNRYEDVFVFEDIVYAMECHLGVVQVCRNCNNSLVKLNDIRYSCKCNNFSFFFHSIIVTNVHILQCCAPNKLIFILDRSGELLRNIPITDSIGHRPLLHQVDVEGNFLIADRYTNRLLIAHADQSSSRKCVVNLTDFPDRVGCEAAVWFRHKLFVPDTKGRLLSFTPVDAHSS